MPRDRPSTSRPMSRRRTKRVRDDHVVLAGIELDADAERQQAIEAEGVAGVAAVIGAGDFRDVAQRSIEDRLARRRT